MQPVKVKDLPRFLAAIEPIARELAEGDILAALAKHAGHLIEATAIGAGVERAWLDEQTPDVLVELSAKVIEVNADFFVQKVLPAMQAAAGTLARIASGGTSGSPGSAAPDLPTAT